MADEKKAPAEQVEKPKAKAEKTKAEKTKAEKTKVDRNSDAPGLGWTRYAEQVNGRFAMVGFVALLLLELFTHQDFFTWLGLR
jgi:Chlorophyll A-B binding protein